jgi:hypothetical protein
MKRKVTRKPKPKRRPRAPASRPAKRTKHVAKKAAAPPPDPIDSLVSAGVQAMRLPLDPAWYGSVKFNLGLIMRLAALVDEFPLADDTEPGPVFHA